MKILYITTIGRTMNFFKKFIEELVQEGHMVDIACNNNISTVPELYDELGCKIYSIQTSRSPFNKGNLYAIKQIRQFVEKEKYDIVHCHTPIAAMCTRIACRQARKKGTKVFYTVHGFHFYKGAPFLNWVIFYPVEWMCAKWTDVLITINREDYELAQKKMKAQKIEYVPGVGIDTERFYNTVIDKSKKRRELDIPEDAFLLLSVGELNTNKNHEIVIRALKEINNEKIHYMIAGMGDLEEKLKVLAKECNVDNRVHLLGYRQDVAELYKAADVFVFPSFREGLSVSVMESLASGLPVVCSKIRGNVDMVEDGVTGWNVNPRKKDDLIQAIKRVSDLSLRSSCRDASRKYDAKEVNKKMHAIYMNN